MLLVEFLYQHLPTIEDAVSFCVTSQSQTIFNKYQIESPVWNVMSRNGEWHVSG